VISITDIFIRRPILASVVSLLILLIGLRAFFALPVRQYPLLSNTVVTVTTGYPGASPDLMQGFITTPIEQAVSSAEGIDYLTSTSIQSQSTVTAYIQLNYDPSKALAEILAKVNQVRYLIPKEATDPVVQKQNGQGTAVMYISFASPELSAVAISDYLNRVVQPLFATVDGVASADIIGGQTFAMRLWLDPMRMAARGINADDVANAIIANNFQSAPGQAKGYFTITNVTANTGLTDVEQFRQMVVKAKEGALIRIADIGTVDLGAQSTTSSVSMNGDHAVFIGVNATPSGNPLEIVKGIRAIMPDLERNLPPSMQMVIGYDSSKFIKASIDEVIRTLAQGVGIVMVVIFLFLGTFRAVTIPVVTIPLSLIGALSLMLALGFSLNLLTLLAMVLAIGLVVDDAIVVVENIYRWIEKGKTPVQAALIGAREIVGPVISMTITLAAVYAPIGFLSGLTGTLFREFAFTLASAVIISGIVALTLSPMMCSVLLTREMSQGWFARLVDRSFAFVTRIYAGLLHGSLDYRPVTALFAVAVIGMLVFEYANVRNELAPPEDQGFLLSILKGPQYANLDYLSEFGDKVDHVLAEFPETEVRFVLNGFGGPNAGIAGMVLKPWDERKRASMQLVAPVQRDYTGTIEGIKAFIFNIPSLPGSTGGLPVQMTVSAPSDYQTIFNVMQQIKDAAQQSGLFFVTDSDLDFNAPVIRLHIDRTKANDMGLTMQAIGDTLAVLVGENFINRFNLEGRSYEVIPQVSRADRLTPEKLAQYFITTPSGQSIPLSSVVSIELATEPNALTQYNQLNSATFSAVPKVPMGDAVAFLEQTARQLLPKGFQHDFLSESRQYVKEGNKLAVTFVFALIVIYLVLAAQFESARDPLVIMVSVPMSLVGALLPLFIGIVSMNIYTQVGLVTLVGLITKHGILMVEFANETQVREDVDRRVAIERAAAIRLRPILMTTAAMVTGLIPLLLATGAGAASRFSIGLVIVTGMSIGTLFTLFVLPMVYTLLAKDHRKAAKSARVAEIAAVMGPEPAE
jgi:multidrug efflux pump